MALALGLGGASQAAAPTGALTQVRIDSGRLAGIPAHDPAVGVFKDIPYTAPPVGPLRLRPPQPARPWSGTRSAASFGALCPQLPPAPAGMTMSEDCPTANVWTGAQSAREKRPVFVWIYGGGFSMGTGSNPQFDGTSLAQKGVVVVTFNYRIGPLGFLATPELSKESGHSASGNYGLLDDIALLKWVQRNIAAFGGDPLRVTIGGQSAGAGSVGFLAMSPLAKGLYHRAIAESHARHPGDPELRFLSTSWRGKVKAEADGSVYTAARGARTLAELRAMPWQKLLEGSDATDMAVETLTNSKPPLFRPVIDGWVLPQNYSATYNARRQNQVIYLAGNNHDETGAVPEAAWPGFRASPDPLRGGMPSISVTLAGYQAWVKRKFGPMAQEFFKLYPASTDDEAAAMSNRAARENSRSSTLLWAEEWRKGVSLPVYPYFWNHTPPGAMLRGAYHGSEISYVFNSLHAQNLAWTDDDRRIAEQMSSYWANFIAKGDPNGPGLPQWPAWQSGSTQLMGLGDKIGPFNAASSERFEFWKRFFAAQEQW